MTTYHIQSIPLDETAYHCADEYGNAHSMISVLILLELKTLAFPVSTLKSESENPVGTPPKAAATYTCFYTGVYFFGQEFIGNSYKHIEIIYYANSYVSIIIMLNGHFP